MKIRNNTIAKVSIYVVGAFFTQGLTFITLPIFSKLMSPADYGLYSSYSFWVAIVGIILGLQMSSSIGNAVIDFGKEKIYTYVSTAIGVGGITFGVLFIITLVFQHPLSNVFEIKEVALLIGVIQSFFIYCLNCMIATLRFIEKPIQYIMLTILNAVVNIGLSIILLYYCICTNLYMGRVFSSLTAAIISGGISILLICKRGHKFFDVSYMKYGLVISIPLIFHSLAGLIFARVDQMILLKTLNSSSAGIYSYSNSIGQIISVIYTAINQAFVPWYYIKMKNGEKDKIIKVGKLYIDFFTVLVIGVMMAIPEVIIHFSDEKYYLAVGIVPILFIAYFINFLYTFPVNYEFYLKKTMYIAGGTIISMFFNLILDILLIPIWGEMGAAFATLISYFLLFLFHFVIAKQLIGEYEFKIGFFIQNIIIVMFFLAVYYFCINRMGLRYMMILGGSIFYIGKYFRKSHSKNKINTTI